MLFKNTKHVKTTGQFGSLLLLVSQIGLQDPAKLYFKDLVWSDAQGFELD